MKARPRPAKKASLAVRRPPSAERVECEAALSVRFHCTYVLRCSKKMCETQTFFEQKVHQPALKERLAQDLPRLTLSTLSLKEEGRGSDSAEKIEKVPVAEGGRKRGSQRREGGREGGGK